MDSAEGDGSIRWDRPLALPCSTQGGSCRHISPQIPAGIVGSAQESPEPAGLCPCTTPVERAIPNKTFFYFCPSVPFGGEDSQQKITLFSSGLFHETQIRAAHSLPPPKKTPTTTPTTTQEDTNNKTLRSCKDDASPEVMPCVCCSVYPCPLSQQLPPSPVHVQPYQHTSERTRTR
jgi:hypothetical protein